ncbi:unnamed protein product, partial [Rotaria socialis]
KEGTVGDKEDILGDQQEHYSEEGLNITIRNWNKWKQLILEVKIFHHLADDQRETMGLNSSSVEFNNREGIITQGSNESGFLAIEDGKENDTFVFV